MNDLANEIWEDIHAYHDGELRGFARWRFERRLRREPEIARELARLGAVGAALREADDAALQGAAAADGPDLWDGIALRLPAVDARRSEPAVEAESGFVGWLRPAGAMAVAAALTLAIWFGGSDATAPAGAGAVQWVDAGGRPVMVLDEAQESGVTIIWMLEDAVEGAARGVGGDMV